MQNKVQISSLKEERNKRKMSKSHVRGTSVEEMTALDILKLSKSRKY